MSLHRLGQPGFPGGGGGGASTNPAVGWDPGQEEFVNVGNMVCGLGFLGSSGAASFSNIPSLSGHPGLGRNSVTNPGDSGVLYSQTPNSIIVGGGTWSFKSLIKVPVLSSGVNRFRTRWGGTVENAATGLTNNEINFRQVDNVNGGLIQAVCRSGGSEAGSAVNTGVALIADTFLSSEIQINAAGTSVSFFIAGVNVATIALNIPITNMAFLALQVDAILGAGGSADIDYWKPTFVAVPSRG